VEIPWGKIDDRSIAQPGWEWTQEESDGVEIDPARVAQVIGDLLAAAEVVQVHGDDIQSTTDEIAS
jgi:hypothetical protein